LADCLVREVVDFLGGMVELSGNRRESGYQE